MAGFNVSALPAFIQYQGQLQAQEQAKQQQQMQLQMFQQQQQDRQRQQAAQAAAGNALPQLMQSGMPAQQPQMPPPPQAPQPGQPSQPMQMPPQGGGAPMPQGPVPGQMQPPPLPPGGAQGQMPPAGVPPFRPMPTSPPPQQAGPAAIPAPPQQQAPQPNPQQDQMEGGFSLSNIIQSGQKQGLSGTDLYDYVQTMEPYMTAQQKAQADKFKTQLELKKLDAEIALHQTAAQNQQLSLAERERHDNALEQLASRRADIAQGHLNISISREGEGAAPAAAQGNPLEPKGTAGYSADAIKALGDDYAVRGPSALAGFGYKNLPPAARAEIVNYAAAKNSETGGNFASNKIQYAADTAGARVNAQQAAKTDAASNALTSPGGIGDQFQQAIDSLNRTGIPIANQAQMQALRLSNDPRIATYDTAMNGVVSESAQILGRGQITVNSMEEARKVVSGWHTSEQAKAGLAQLKREAATTVKASSEEVAKSARTPKGQPGIKNGPTKISSDADYEALPSGAQFIAPDGTTRRKP
jgi:hypothetical protein